MPEPGTNKPLEVGDTFLVNTSTIWIEDWHEAVFVKWSNQEQSIGLGSFWYDETLIQFEFPVLGFDHDERVKRLEEE